MRSLACSSLVFLWALLLAAPAAAHPGGSAVGCDDFMALGLALHFHLADCNAPMASSPHAGVNPPTAGDLCWNTVAARPMTPNECAAKVYDAPPPPESVFLQPLQWTYLSACENGDPTALCPGEEVTCLDGSRPGFYIDWATDAAGAESPTNDWVFYFSGGGSCVTAEECLADYQTVTGDTSTCPAETCPFADPDGDGIAEGRSTVPAYKTVSGILNATAANAFHGYNRVFFEKCTNDGYLGTTTRLAQPTSAGVVGRLPQHGNLFIQRAFAQLDNPAAFPGYPLLRDADTIVLVGNSGGGKGLALTGDDHRDHLESQILAGGAGLGRVRLVIDAQFLSSLEQENALQTGASHLYESDHWTDPPPNAALPPDETGTAALDYGTEPFDSGPSGQTVATRQPPLDASCLAVHPDDPSTTTVDESKPCHDEFHVILHHLTTPTFIKMDINDNVKRSAAPNYAIDTGYRWVVREFHRRVRSQLAGYLEHFASLSELALDVDTSPAVASDNARKPIDQDLAVFAPFDGTADSHTGLINSIHFGLPTAPTQVTLHACDLATGLAGTADPITGWTAAGTPRTAMSTLFDWVTTGQQSDAVDGYVNQTHGYLWIDGDLPCPPRQTRVLGKKILVKNPRAGLGAAVEEPRRKVIAIAKESPSPVTTLLGDPTVDGATLRIQINGTVFSDETYTLDASGWSVIGNPAATGGYRFRNGPAIGLSVPVTRVSIQNTPGVKLVIRITLRGSTGTDDLLIVPASPHPPAPSVHGNLLDARVSLTLGNTESFCFQLGGAAGGQIRKDNAKVAQLQATASAPASSSQWCPF